MQRRVQTPGESPLPEEMPGFKPKKSAVVNVGDIRAEVVGEKSDYPGYVRAAITFNDAFQIELSENHGWNDGQAVSMDTQLATKLKGLNATVHWEDRELFHVDVPAANTRDVVSDVATALKSLIQKPLTNTEIDEAGGEVKAAGEAAENSLRKRVAETRSEENLFQAYKDLVFGKPGGHRGYCSVMRTTFVKAGGIGYDDGEFLGSEHRRIATKKGMCILDVSVDGEPFHRLYADREITEGRFGFPEEYGSELLKLVGDLETAWEVVKAQARITSRKGKLADGERVKLLCTWEFSQKVVSALKARYSDLQDIAQQNG